MAFLVFWKSYQWRELSLNFFFFFCSNGVRYLICLYFTEGKREREKASLNSFILNTAVAQHTGKHFIICWVHSFADLTTISSNSILQLGKMNKCGPLSFSKHANAKLSASIGSNQLNWKWVPLSNMLIPLWVPSQKINTAVNAEGCGMNTVIVFSGIKYLLG